MRGGSPTPPGVKPGPAPDDAGQYPNGPEQYPSDPDHGTGGGGSGPILTPDPKFGET